MTNLLKFGCSLSFILCMVLGASAHAEFSDLHPIHHFFNSRLLAPKETQVSILGNVKMGVHEDWEIGTWALLYLPKYTAPNLAIKHQMFRGKSFQTSFNGHVILPYVKGASSTTPTASLAFFGIVNTWTLKSNHFINAGFFDANLWLKNQAGIAKEGDMHLLTASLGWDHYLSSHWALSTLILQPLLVLAKIKSDTQDGEFNLSFLNNSIAPNLTDVARFGMVTLIRSWEEFNFEFGVLTSGGMKKDGKILLQPYMNAFWRI